MKKQETKKRIKIQHEPNTQEAQNQKEVDFPRLTSDFLEETLQIA